MLKLGLVQYAQLARPRTWFGAQKYASLLLLRELFGRSPRVHAHYDTILRLLLMANGTWKDTFRGRFKLLDTVAMEVLGDTTSQGARLAVTDLGASSGITSVEFYHALGSRFSVDFVATDRWRDAFAIRDPRFGWTVILDAEGAELQHIVGPFVLPGQGQESALYPINRVLRQLSHRVVGTRAQHALRCYNGHAHDDFESTVIDGGYEVTKIPLMSAECLELTRGDPNFRFEVANILEPFGRSADVIRAMNLITPSHFGPADLRRAIEHCVSALNAGGILILGRSPTDDPCEVDATIYANHAQGLEIVRRVNRGSEVEALVDAVSRAHPGSRPPVRRSVAS